MSNNNNNGIQVVKFENFYKALKPNTTTTKSGIIFFNSSDTEEDNAMFSKIEDLILKSPIHSLFIELKSSLLYASGLYSVDENNTALSEFLKTKNRVGDTPDKVFKKACDDFGTYEQAFIEIIPNREGGMAEIYHKPVNYIRIGEEVDEFDNPLFYYYSKTWGDITNKRQKNRRNDIANAVKIPSFNPEKLNTNQIIHIKRGSNPYTIPKYLSAENWIHLVYEISKYVLNKFQGGYHVDGFLYLNSEMSDEQKEQFVADFKKKYQGTEGNKIVFLFNNVASSKPEFVPIQDALGNAVFAEYMNAAIGQICFAHGGGLELLGLSNSDSFGSSNPDSNDINVVRLKFILDVIKPMQIELLDGFNRIFDINKLGEATVLNETLKLTLPTEQATDTTVSERREILFGLPPLPEAATSAPASTEPIKSIVQ